MVTEATKGENRMKTIPIEEIREKASKPSFAVGRGFMDIKNEVVSARRDYEKHCLNTHQMLLDALKEARVGLNALVSMCGDDEDITRLESVERTIQTASTVEVSDD